MLFKQGVGRGGGVAGEELGRAGCGLRGSRVVGLVGKRWDQGLLAADLGSGCAVTSLVTVMTLVGRGLARRAVWPGRVGREPWAQSHSVSRALGGDGLGPRGPRDRGLSCQGHLLAVTPEATGRAVPRAGCGEARSADGEEPVRARKAPPVYATIKLGSEWENGGLAAA